jgi:hypothetical protein
MSNDGDSATGKRFAFSIFVREKNVNSQSHTGKILTLAQRKKKPKLENKVGPLA